MCRLNVKSKSIGFLFSVFILVADYDKCMHFSNTNFFILRRMSCYIVVDISVLIETSDFIICKQVMVNFFGGGILAINMYLKPPRHQQDENNTPIVLK